MTFKMNSEVFYPRNNNIGSFVVEVIGTDMINDTMTVLYIEEEYTLKWAPQHSYYEGVVASHWGFML